MPKKLRENDYLYLSAYIHALENRLLTGARTERMLEARTTAEAVKVMGECGYPELTELSPAGIDRMLAASRQELYRQLRGLMPDPAMLDVFILRNDYHNAKVLIKAEAMGLDPEPLFIDSGRWPAARLREEYAQDHFTTVTPQFAAAVAKAKDTLAHTGDPQAADLVLDRACYEELTAAANAVDSPFLTGYASLTVDAANLRSAVRTVRMGRDAGFLKQVLLPGGTVRPEALALAAGDGDSMTRLFAGSPLAAAAEAGAQVLRSGSLTRFERLCDNAVVLYMRQARRRPLGEEPVIGYLYARECELTAIRIILTGRLAGLAADTIRERLRESYA